MPKSGKGYVFLDEERGKYVARVTFVDEHGKRRNLKKYCENKTEANDALIELNAKVRAREAATMLDSKAVTLNALLDRWLELAVKGRVSLRTEQDYTDLMRRYVREPLGKRSLMTIRTVHVQQLHQDLLKRGLSPRVVRYVHGLLNQAFKRALVWGLLTKNPCEGVDLPKMRKRDIQVLTIEESARFIETALGMDDGLMFVFALETATRPEEFLALQWPDIDWQRGTVTIQRALVRVTGRWEFAETKTHKSRRTLPLSHPLLDRLKEHRQAQREQRMKLGAGYHEHNLVFAGADGQPLRQDGLRYRLRPILKAAGLPETIRPYALRHSGATLSLILGQNLKSISERLGHSSIQLTANTYLHVSEQMQRQVTDKLAGVLYPKASNQ